MVKLFNRFGSNSDPLWYQIVAKRLTRAAFRNLKDAQRRLKNQVKQKKRTGRPENKRSRNDFLSLGPFLGGAR